VQQALYPSPSILHTYYNYKERTHACPSNHTEKLVISCTRIYQGGSKQCAILSNVLRIYTKHHEHAKYSPISSYGSCTQKQSHSFFLYTRSTSSQTSIPHQSNHPNHRNASHPSPNSPPHQILHQLQPRSPRSPHTHFSHSHLQASTEPHDNSPPDITSRSRRDASNPLRIIVFGLQLFEAVASDVHVCEDSLFSYKLSARL
jgi:hypothetical protein